MSFGFLGRLFGNKTGGGSGSNLVPQNVEAISVVKSNLSPDIPEEKVISLKKRGEKIDVVCLKKAPGLKIVTQVVEILDISGSTEDEYRDGTIQETVERLYPLAIKFDDDGLLDSWVFSNNFKHLTPVDGSNFADYVDSEIIRKHLSCAWSGTLYAPVIEAVVKKYKNAKDPAYVIFITDGDNDDEGQTERILKASLKLPIFWQFIGVGRPQRRFRTLKELDKMLDNVNFFELRDLRSVVDDDLYHRLVNDEFVRWYKKVK